MTEIKAHYDAGDKTSGDARPAKRSAAPPEKHADALQQPAHTYPGVFVRLFEIFCFYCERSDLVGLHQTRYKARSEAFRIGWTTDDDGYWICPNCGILVQFNDTNMEKWIQKG